MLKDQKSGDYGYSAMKQSQCCNIKKTFPLLEAAERSKKSRMTGGL
jgi:hypothetical protein